MTIRAALRWTEGMQFVARADQGPAVVMDSRDGRSGPSPMEMVLMGVAGCTAIDVVAIMEKKRVTLKRFEVVIEGEQAEDHPRRYTHLHVTYRLYGQDIKPKAVEQAIDLSENKYCSAMASLNAKVSHDYEIIPE